MAQITDLLATAQNLVQAVYALTQAAAISRGNITSMTVDADTLICVGQGRLVNVSVTVVGSSEGVVHNAASVAAANAENALVAVEPTSPDVILAGQAFTAGLVVKPGTGQSLNVTYFQ